MRHKEIVNTLRKEGATLYKNIKVISVITERYWEANEEIQVKLDEEIDSCEENWDTDTITMKMTDTIIVDYYSILSSLEQNPNTSFIVEYLPDNINWLKGILAHATVSIVTKKLIEGESYTRFGWDSDFNSNLFTDIPKAVNYIVDIELNDAGLAFLRRIQDYLFFEK